MNKPTLTTFDDRHDLDATLAGDIAARLRTALQTRREASLVVSGGQTPIGMFRALSHGALDWASVTVTLADERWVAASHHESNEKLVRKNLLRHGARAARFVSLKTRHKSPQQGEAACERRLGELRWPLDVVHLGMGEDGHTASWFVTAPEYAVLDSCERTAMAIHPPGQTARMTLTPQAIFNSRHIALQITGDAKRRVLEQALSGRAQLPINRVLQQDHIPVDIYWAP